MIAFRDRLSCTVAEACEATGLGKNTIYQWIEEGRLVSQLVTVKPGSTRQRRLISVASLMRQVPHADLAVAEAAE